MRRFAAVLLPLACLAACGSTHGQDDASETPLLGAQEDTAHPFAVGLCLGRHSPGGSMGPAGTCGALSSVCTGTLIAPNLVLTARHCISKLRIGAPLAMCTSTEANTFEGTSHPMEITVTTSPSVREGSPKWYEVRKFILPSSKSLCNDDIALLLLEKNVPAVEATPIEADVWTDLGETKPKEMAIVGRGAILEEYNVGPGTEAAYDRGAYRRRFMTNIPVTCIPRTMGDCKVTDFTIKQPPNQFDLSPGQIVLGPAALGGDSGSGYLDQGSFDAKSPRVVAVMSYSGVDERGKPNSSIGIRLLPHRALLIEAAEEAAAFGHYPVPTWATSR